MAVKSKPIIPRQETLPIADILQYCIRKWNLEDDFIKLQIYQEWDNIVAKMGRNICIGRYFKDGILYCTISSSAIRNILYFDLQGIVTRINNKVGGDNLKKIVLR